MSGGYNPPLSDEDLREFETRWARGDTIADLAEAFLTSPSFVCKVRKRLGLPTRCDPDGRYRGSRYGIRDAFRRGRGHK